MSETAVLEQLATGAGGGDLRWGNDVLTVTIVVPAAGSPFIGAVETSSLALRMPPGLPLVDVVTVGGGHAPASARLVHSSLGEALRYRAHRATVEGTVSRLEIDLADEEGLAAVTMHLSAPAGLAVLHARVEVAVGAAARPLVLRSVTSFSSYLGARAGTESVPAWVLHHARSDWLGEGRWERQALDGQVVPALEEQLTGHDPRGQLSVTAAGTWSTGSALPTAAVVSDTAGAAWAWQVEHNGAWRFDVGQDTADRWFALSGPTDDDHQWSMVLDRGERFESIPVTVALAADLEGATAELTRYRRRVRRFHPDNAAMPVVFNDYMNTLNGDPTTEVLMPLIDAAAEVGAEVFCIDAGWYADGFWWDSVGEWRASEQRFPGGLGLVVDHIREAGMVPGLWLEPEVIGVNSPMAARLPEAAFLSRHGQRVVEHDRYHLDLRHPAAVAHLDEVVDRLVAHYGVGFFKFDYNINPGPGTDRNADSVGDGLLQHNRAHLAWLDAVLDRHPTLIIENCGSGAMRSDFAMLSRLQMQSTSDQQDWRRYPPIAAAAPMQMLPEQAASWAYPQADMTAEEVAFCLVTGLLGRFYLSGYLNRMDDSQRAMVAESIDVAKQLRTEIAAAVPFWPLGLPQWEDDTVALGLRTEDALLVAVWDRAGAAEVVLDLPDLTEASVEATEIFPTSLPSWTTQQVQGSGGIRVHNPTDVVGARIFRIRPSRSDV